MKTSNLFFTSIAGIAALIVVLVAETHPAQAFCIYNEGEGSRYVKIVGMGGNYDRLKAYDTKVAGGKKSCCPYKNKECGGAKTKKITIRVGKTKSKISCKKEILAGGWLIIDRNGFCTARYSGGAPMESFNDKRMCVDVSKKKLKNGQPVHLWKCNDNWNQHWGFKPHKGVTYGHITIRHDPALNALNRVRKPLTKCLQASGSGKIGESIVIGRCKGKVAEWVVNHKGNLGVIANRAKTGCLAWVNRNNRKNGAKLTLGSCDKVNHANMFKTYWNWPESR